MTSLVLVVSFGLCIGLVGELVCCCGCCVVGFGCLVCRLFCFVLVFDCGPVWLIWVLTVVWCLFDVGLLVVWLGFDLIIVGNVVDCFCWVVVGIVLGCAGLLWVLVGISSFYFGVWDIGLWLPINSCY